MKIGIIILNWNQEEYTLRCLQSISPLKYDCIELQTYLVDNNSKSLNEELMKQALPDLKIIRLPENIGYTGGNNVGIKIALDDMCEYILVANNDTIFTSDLIPELTLTMKSDEKIASVSPKVLFYKEHNKIQFAGGHLNLYLGQFKHIGYNSNDNGAHDTEKEINFFSGCAVLLRSATIRELGGFKDTYFAYCEDAEMSVRIRKSGYKLFYNGHASIYHDESPSLGGYLNPVAFYLSKRNSLYLVNEHGNFMERLVFTVYSHTIFLFMTMAYSIIKKRSDILKMYLRALIDYRKGLCGKPFFLN
jgi:GT2 family glycosyltransferase